MIFEVSPISFSTNFLQLLNPFCCLWLCAFSNSLYKNMFYPHSKLTHIIFLMFYIFNEVTVAYFISRWENKLHQSPPSPPHPEVVNQIKLPSLCLSFRLTCALSGCVLAGPFYSNSLKHRASFVVRFFFLFPYKVFVKKSRVFWSWAQVHSSNLMLPVLAAFVHTCSGKQPCPTHLVYHT